MFRKITVLLIVLLLISGLAAAQDESSNENYRVRWADTLDVIGQQLDVSVACLVDANGLTDANQLKFAQMLVVPPDCGPYDEIESVIVANHGPLTAAVPAQDQGGGGAGGDQYRTHWADSLDVIGQQYNVSVACLAGANGLINANRLAYAQVIIIPADCEPYNSIESDIIANIDDLSQIGLTESQLGRGSGGGQSLLEPGSQPTETPPADTTTSMNSGGGTTPATTTQAAMPNETYVIQWGDNLTRIAARFNASADCLQRVNRIYDPDMIYAGNQLLISAQCRLTT